MLQCKKAFKAAVVSIAIACQIKKIQFVESCVNGTVKKNSFAF